MRNIYRLAIAGAGAFLAFGAIGATCVAAQAAAPSHAVSHHSSSSSAVLGAVARSDHVRLNTGYDSLLAGYYGAPAAGIASASASFTAPSFACGRSTDTENISFGPYVFDGSGTAEAAADIQPVCEDGTLYYNLSAFTVAGGNNYVDVVSSGDHIIASIAVSQSGNTTATVTDTTTGTTETSVGTTDASDSFVSEGVLNYQPDVPSFSRVTETSVQVDGQYLGEVGFTRFNLRTANNTQIGAGSVSTYSETLKLTFERHF